MWTIYKRFSIESPVYPLSIELQERECNASSMCVVFYVIFTEPNAVGLGDYGKSGYRKFKGLESGA
jgi:hypothetical protein